MTEQDLKLQAIKDAAEKAQAKAAALAKAKHYAELRAKHDEAKFMKSCGVDL